MSKNVASGPSATVESPAGRGFGGLRVVAFESRLASEAAHLIEKAGGVAISAPSMRELPITDNPQAVRFVEKLLIGGYDLIVFMTGVGTRYLFEAVAGRFDRDQIVDALSRATVVARGPKPVRVLRELGVRIAITVPEPNTWREILIAMDESAAGVPLTGARVAVQEYGTTNEPFLSELAARGAEVTPVPVYRWALPEDRGPLLAGIRQIIGHTADVALFTSATQVHNVLTAAREAGLEKPLRDAMAHICICSIGPVCSEALVENAIGVDLEPTHTKLGILVREAAERAGDILADKRGIRLERAVGAAGERASVAPTHPTADSRPLYENSAFLRACRLEPTDYTPVWLMRQAGRYMREYRELRARVSFVELCKRPELAAEVAVTAAERLRTDAAILFSDILLIVEPMGLGLEFVHGEGPSLTRLVRTAADVDRLERVDPKESLSFVFEAVRSTRRALDERVPLIGFAGAPFTLASYIIEGGSSRAYSATKELMFRDQGAWDAMMSLIAEAVGAYLAGQIEAGCQAVQLFDSWVGCLSPDDYQRYVLPHTRKVFEALPDGVPAIHFGTDTATLLDHQLAAGGNVLGVDHRTPIAEVGRRYPKVAIQGNLDPAVLLAEPDFIRDACRRVLDQVAGRRGHVFNLGHGVLPNTPVDHVIAAVDAVHELSDRR